METLKSIILKKPTFFIIATLLYLLVTYLLKWRLTFVPGGLIYAIGGIAGMYFLDAAEAFFKLSPSPFRSIIFSIGFSAVSFFVVTSSGSFLAAGLVLTTYMTLIFWQIGEWKLTGNNTSWYRMIAGLASHKTQQWILFSFVLVFLVQTFLFVR